jgi:hypothetical protein
MLKKLLFFSVFFFLSNPFAYGATSYSISSNMTNCSEYPTISNVSGHKFIPSSINTSAPTS